MPGQYVHVVFRLHNLPDSVRVKEGTGKILCSRICILGSIPELGVWDFKKHVKASPLNNFSKWEARAMIPAGSTFEWNWIILDYRCTEVLTWDSCRRNTIIGNFGGTVHTAWNRPTQAFRSDTCGVELSMDYHCTHGQYLVVTGGEPCLGNWDPNMGVEAREEFPSGSARWKANLVLQKLHGYDWKWVVVEGPYRRVVRWEEVHPHHLFIEKDVDRIQLEVAWESLYFMDSRTCRLRPDYEDPKDDAEILKVLENLQAMEEMNGRKIEETNQPRRQSAKQNKVSSKKKKKSKSVNKKQGAKQSADMQTAFPDTQGHSTSATSGTPKADDISQGTGFSLFRWISNVFITYLDLVEG